MRGVRRETLGALAAAGLKPRRRFGQHFLCDGGVVDRIVETAGIGPATVVLEIGPGLGALTDTLAARARRLYLVEIDRDLGALLGERFAAASHVRVIVGDVLARPLEELVPEEDVTVVANLPYNIGTEVVFRLLESRQRFPRAVLMLQREVAERLTARPGSDMWGVASVLVERLGTARGGLVTGGSFRVVVYAGKDPITGRKSDVKESHPTPAAAHAALERLPP